jgi:UPF0755 protein
MCYFDYSLYRRIKKITFIFKIAVPSIIIVCLALFAFRPLSLKYEKPQLFNIPKGSPLKKIAFKLYDEKLVGNPYLFYFIGFISGYSRYIQAGTYYVSANQSPASIYRELVNGKIAKAKVVIPPGLNIFETSLILSNNKITDKKKFVQDCFNKKFLLSLNINADSAEGFLYPDTYIFKINSKPKNVIKEMVNEFYEKTKKLNPDYKDLIIASLIIKEANESDKNSANLISSVIHNRLNINMPLDIDSTSIYTLNILMYKNYLKGEGKYNPVLHMRQKYLKEKSVYNTYMNYGLPPTPIANPDIVAIRAAMRPARTKYLFYISTKTGKTLFSASLTGQIKNIDKYLK